MSVKKTCIMWIGAHPDDESQASGTLAKFVKNGHRAVICVVSKAEKGSIEIPPDELVRIRDEEMAEAAKILGAEYYGNLGETDLEVSATNELIHKVVKAIRAVKPDIVITHWERDYQRDHISTSKAVSHAVLCANHPIYDPGTPPSRVQRLYYSDTAVGLDFEPDFWVDISDVEETKLKSLAAHKSQLVFMGRGGQDFVEARRIHDRFRGLQVGCKYAEAFKATRRRSFVQAELGLFKSLISMPKLIEQKL